MLRMFKNCQKIHFFYNLKHFVLELDRHSIPGYLDVDFDTVCGSSDEDGCEHDGNHCMEIKNISKGNFQLDTYLKNSLYANNSEDKEFLSEVIEVIVPILSTVNFPDYIDCEAEGDYYGESLSKTVNIEKLEDTLRQALQSNALIQVRP